MPRGIPKNGVRRPRGLGLWKKEAEERKLRNQQIAAQVYGGETVLQKTLNPDTPDSGESDEQIHQKLDTRFRVLRNLTESICIGTSRALIVSGPAGLSKSYTVEETVKKLGNAYFLAKGFLRPASLYSTLYKYKHPGCVVIFDDCDAVFGDTTSLNLLKAACDTTEERKITWGATKMEDDEGERLPESFEFEGSVVVITNFDFETAIEAGHRYADHFLAMMSRAHYIDMAMKTRRDYLIKIKTTIEEGMLLPKNLKAEQQKMLQKFLEDNAPKFRELSLRTALKMADLVNMDPKHWQDYVKVTMFKKGAA